MRPLILSLISSIALLLPFVTWLSRPASAAPTCFGKRATITGTPGRDWIKGTAGDDVIVTFGEKDTIQAGRGKDRICSGGGPDVVYAEDGHDRIKAGSQSDLVDGGRGRDRLYGNRGGDRIPGGDRQDDVIVGGKGSDTVTYLGSRRAWVDLRRGLARWNGRDTLRSIENATGGRGDDVLRGDPGHNDLDGGHGGKDTLAGRGGNDILAPAEPFEEQRLRVYGGNGRDLVSFEGMRQVEVDLAMERAWIGDRNYRGYSTVELHSIESVVGSDEDDLIRGDSGDNYLAGGLGDDVLTGQPGMDILFGQEGADIVIGGADDDLLDGSAGQDFVAFGETTTDVVVDLAWATATSSHGTDILVEVEGAYGTAIDDEMRGNHERNVFFGLGGNDVLTGAGGDDWLDGGEGSDDADGGDGDDTCIEIEAATNCERFTP